MPFADSKSLECKQLDLREKMQKLEDLLKQLCSSTQESLDLHRKASCQALALAPPVADVTCSVMASKVKNREAELDTIVAKAKTLDKVFIYTRKNAKAQKNYMLCSTSKSSRRS